MITKSQLYRFLHPWLDTGLLTSTGTKWKQRRRLLTPAFHFSILKDFAEVFKNEADILVQKVKPFADKNEIFDISQPVTLCTLDVICETAMGVKVGAQDNKHNKYIEAVMGLSKLIQRRQRSPWLWPNVIYNNVPSGQTHNHYVECLHKFTTKVINDRIDERAAALKESGELVVSESPRKRQAFLDLLLDSYEQDDIDIAGIREEVDTFMFEGHDTTSHGISFAMYCLGRHPEIQKQVQEEVDALFVDDRDKLIEATKEMKLLERVIKESLRLYPPVPIIGREVEEDQKVGDLQLYKGTSIAIFIFALHRNPKIWENPNKFDPDRFLPEKCAKRNPYAYIPFSAGPRNCIGQRFALMEEKFILATFLHKYEIISLDAEPELVVCGEIITRADKGIRVQLKPRKINS